jgi:hypothetical protein
MTRNTLSRIHLSAAVVGLVLIATFWTSTIIVELFAGPATVAALKQAILWGMLALVPAMAAAGATGFRLGGRSKAPVITAKQRRMMAIAANGIVVLVPSAFFLAARAVAGNFDTAFYAVQAVELLAGATNLSLMGLNMRDGFAMTSRRRRRTAESAAG